MSGGFDLHHQGDFEEMTGMIADDEVKQVQFGIRHLDQLEAIL